MSADSPCRPGPQTKRSNGTIAIFPQQVTDPTILDSVAGFINEVVPTSYNVPCDSKDQIQWAHFEQLDADEHSLSLLYDAEKSIPPPLLLVIGYTTGIQVGKNIVLLIYRHISSSYV